MFGRMDKARRSLGIRLATLFAACLTSLTAFGLHPEPGAPRNEASVSIGIDLPSTRAVDPGSHDCLACRAHRPLVSVANLASVPSPRRSTPRVLVSRPSLVAAFEPASADGRAPPDLS
jgi:hypothetical protein